MKFTLAGHSLELTQGVVELKLEGHSPEPIREHWVDVRGVKWPVKQVLAIATGIERRNFQSQNSARLLERLGFPVGVTTNTSGRPATGVEPPFADSSVSAEAVQVVETVDVHIRFDWVRSGAVTLDGESLPVFPRLPRVPGLYRFDFGSDLSGTLTIYIGESVNLARRASNYRNAKTDRSRQRTSRRIHQTIVAHLSSGGHIDFSVATSATMVGAAAADLRRTSARRLAENAAVLQAQIRPRTRVLNIDAGVPASEDEA